MTPQQLAEQTQARVAQTLGQTTMKMVEAQAAADLLMAENEALHGQVEALTAELEALRGKAAPE